MHGWLAAILNLLGMGGGSGVTPITIPTICVPGYDRSTIAVAGADLSTVTIAGRDRSTITVAATVPEC